MSVPSDKPSSIKGKVIAAFLLGSFGIMLALSVTYYSFYGLLNTVDRLTESNPKLTVLNRLYQQVTQLDQLQRAEAIRHPGKYPSMLEASKPLMLTLDSLRAMPWGNQSQLQRLDDMEAILQKRNKLLQSYLLVKSEFIDNKKFSRGLELLDSMILSTQSSSDTSVKTTEKRTVTTTYLPGHPADGKVANEDNRSFLEKVLGKKKEEKPEETRVEIQEELNVTIDTVTTAPQDSAIAEIGRMMKTIEEDHRQQNRQILRRELELISANQNLINQLINSLREVESEEKAIQQNKNKEAAVLVNDSIRRIGIIMAIFFLGSAVLAFLILTDITKSNTLRRQLIKAKDEAERSGHVKQRFLANMSHEIRTPLQSIIGYAEQLKHGTEGEPEAVNAIYSSSEHLLHIVNEVLDFSKIESGKMVLARESFDLYKVIQEVQASVRVQADRKHLAFTLDTAPQTSSLRLIGDAFRLRQILYNVLGNAIKFTPQGGVTLKVYSEEKEYMVNCVFEIIDTGIGMTEDDINHVFQQFEQARSSTNGHYGGTGLGLTIVKSLVDAQQGFITIRSEPEKGSTVRIEIAFDKAPKEKVRAHTPQQTLPDKFEGQVIVVDDDPMILRLCGTMLTRHSVRHTLFNESEKALGAELSEEVRLILLDIRMPGLSGTDLCTALRKKAPATTKIVALTAHVLPHERASLLGHGFDQVLTKPFRETDLLQLLGMVGAAATTAPDKVLPAATSNDNTLPHETPDFTTLRQMTMGDEALLHTILTEFIQETTDDLEKLDVKLNTGQPAGDVRETVHRLAGRTGQIGMKHVSGKFRELELQLDKGDLPTPALKTTAAHLKTLLQTLEASLPV